LLLMLTSARLMQTFIVYASRSKSHAALWCCLRFKMLLLAVAAVHANLTCLFKKAPEKTQSSVAALPVA